MASSGRFDPQVGFRHQRIVPRNSYERPSSSRASEFLTSGHDPVQVGLRPLELEVGRTASRAGHPQHRLGHRLPRPGGSARIHSGVNDLHGEDRRSPTSDQRLDGCDHLVPAGGNGRLASPQVDGPTGDRWAWLAFRGATSTNRLTCFPAGQAVFVRAPNARRTPIGHAARGRRTATSSGRCGPGSWFRERLRRSCAASRPGRGTPHSSAGRGRVGRGVLGRTDPFRG